MFYCENYKYEVKKDDDFCPKCGALYSKFSCENHSETEAEGVCLVCGQISCSKCGQFVNQSYLCDEHSAIEVYQSMGKIYGSSDAVEIDYLISMLENSDFHPLKFNRKHSPISLGGSDYSLFKASGEPNGYIINEIKILVPLNEYKEAKNLVEQILKN